MSLFIHNLIRTFAANLSFKTTIIDVTNFFESSPYVGINYVNAKFNELVDRIKSVDDTIQEILQKNNMNYRAIDKIGNNVFIVLGFEKFYNKLDDDHKKMFQQILNNNRENPKINFITFDIPFGFKKYDYEDWFKNNFDGNNAIWIGGSIAQQFVVKTSTQPAALAMLTNDYAVIVKNSVPVAIKIINEIK